MTIQSIEIITNCVMHDCVVINSDVDGTSLLPFCQHRLHARAFLVMTGNDKHQKLVSSRDL